MAENEWWAGDRVDSTGGDGGADLFEMAGFKVEPKKPPKPGGVGQFIADMGKRAAGAVVSGVASIPEAIQSGLRAGVRSGAGGDPATVMPGGAFIPGVDTDEAINGPMTERQLGRRELQGERIAGAVSVPGAAPLARAGKAAQQSIADTTSQATKDAVAGSQITGNLLKGEIDFGTNPSFRGFVMQGADVFGSMLPVVATALATRSPTAAGAVGGAMAAGEGVGNARDFVAKMTDEQLQEHSPLYKRMVDAGASPAEARQIVSRKAEDASALLQGAVAAAGDRFTGSLVTGGLDKLLQRAAGKSVLGRAAAGGAMSSLEEGTQELTEGVASNLGTKSVVGSKEIGEGSAANFVLGAIGGGAPGAARGAYTAATQPKAAGTPSPAPAASPDEVAGSDAPAPAAALSEGAEESPAGTTPPAGAEPVSTESTPQPEARPQLLQELEAVARGATGETKQNAIELLAQLERSDMPPHVRRFAEQEAQALMAGAEVAPPAVDEESAPAAEPVPEPPQGGRLTPQERQEFERAYRRPVADPLGELQDRVRAGSAYTQAGDVRQLRERLEDAWLELNVATEGQQPAAAPAQAGAPAQIDGEAIHRVDAQLRTRRIRDALQNLLDEDVGNTVQIVGRLDGALEKIGEPGLDDGERQAVRRVADAYFGFRGARERAPLPKAAERAEDWGADNSSMEALIQERGVARTRSRDRAGYAPAAEDSQPTAAAPAVDAFDPGAVRAKTWPQFVSERGENVARLRRGSPAWDRLQNEWAAVKTKRAGTNPEGTGAVGAATPEIQNRDRARPASVVQMQGMAQSPDYMRLGPSRSPETGAPMVFAVGDQVHAAHAIGRGDTAVMSDGQRVPFQYAVMEAGDVQPSNFADGGVNPLFDAAHPGTVKALNNGRTAGLRAAYERGTADSYRQELMADSAMHGIDPQVIASMRAPMLVRLYSERDNQANMGAKSQSQALGLSAAEQAATDAALLDAGVLDVLEAGDLASAANRDFARAFVGKLQAEGQDVAGMLDAGGALSPAGVVRLQAALVHKAYGDGDLVESMFGSTDNDIRAIGEALKDVAGEWANLRQATAVGAVNPQVDVTGNLLQAIRLVQKARRERASLYDAINQVDMVTGDVPDPMTVGVLRLLYSGHYLTRALGRERVAQALRDYLGAAAATRAEGDMFGEQVGPAAILFALSAQPTEKASDATATTEPSRQPPPATPQGERGATGGDPAGRGADEPGGQARGPVADRGGEDVAEDGRRGEGEDAQAPGGQPDGEGDPGTAEDGRGEVAPEPAAAPPDASSQMEAPVQYVPQSRSKGGPEVADDFDVDTFLRTMEDAPAVPDEAKVQAVARTESAAAAIRSGWANGPEVVVAFDMADPKVPQQVRDADLSQRSRGAGGSPEGFYFGGRVYLLAEQLPREQDVARVLMHEALGHHGLAVVFGAGLDAVRQQLAQARPAEVRRKAAEYGLDYNDRAQRMQAAEEVLAEMAQTRPELGFVRRAVAAVRSWARAHIPGFAGLRMTDAEIIRDFILPARGWVERGRGAATAPAAAGGAPALAFSLSDGALTQARAKWAGVVDQFVRGGLDATKTYEVLPSSTAVMKMLGLPDLPVHAGVHAMDALYNHGVKPSQMKQILDELANPRMVMVWNKGSRGELSLNFVTSMSNAQGEPFIIAVKPNRSTRAGRHHWVATVTQKQPRAILDMVREGGAMYVGEGEIAGVGAQEMREALRFAKEKRGKEARGLMQAIGTRDSLPNLVHRVLYAKDLDGFKVAEQDGQPPAAPDAQAGADQQGLSSSPGAAATPGGDGKDASPTQFARTAPVDTSMGPMTAAQERVWKKVAGTATVPTLKQRTEALRQNFGVRAKQALVDQFAPIQDVSQEAYMLARMSKGADGTMEAAMLYGRPFLRDGVPDVDVKEGGFAQVLASLKGEHDRFLWWVAAQRAERLKAEGKENLMSVDDIGVLKTLNAGAMADGTARGAVYAKALRDLNSFNDGVLKMALDSGLIDQGAYDLFRDQPYVPFYRLMAEGEMQGRRFSSGLVNQKAWQKLKGGTEQLNADLLQNTLLNWSHLYAAAARNRAAVATMDAAEKLGVAYPVDEGTKGAVKVMRAGEAQHWAVEDPYLLEAISALNYTSSPLMKPLAKMKQILTFGVTVNPTFKIRNLIRDSLSAIAQSELGYNPAANVGRGWKLTARDSQTYASMLASGGIIKFGTQENTDRLRDQVAKLGGVVLDQRGWKKLTGQLATAWEAYSDLGDRAENVNRAALYDQLVAKGHSHAEASFMARDLMDFSMSGNHAVVRFLTQSVPFLNARLQGLYKLGRAAHDNPRRFAMVAGAVSLASLALLGAYGDDDDWKKREDWDRDSYWWFKIGDTAYRIPKPFEVGAIGTLAERTAELMLSDEMTGERFRKRLAHMVSQTFAFDPVPQAVKPLLDIYANKDSFTGRAIESQADQRLRPQDRHDERTSEVARMLGGWGLPDPARLVKGEWADLSPKQVDYLLRGYFSWAGTVAVSAADSMARPLLDRGDRPDMRLKDMFVVGNFVESLPAAGSRYVTQVYEQAKQVEQAYASYREAIKSGDLEKAEEIRRDEAPKLRHRAAYVRATRALSELSQRAKAVKGNAELSGAEKRQRLDAIEARRAEIGHRMNALTAEP